MGAWIRARRDRPRLRLGQSLGAFAGPGGEISPLQVFFEVGNEGRQDVEIRRLHVRPKGEDRATYEGPFEGDRGLPCGLSPGERIRFWTRAKPLAASLAEAGYGGMPRVSLVVEDALGNRHEKTFRFRVDEYLRLKDE